MSNRQGSPSQPQTQNSYVRSGRGPQWLFSPPLHFISASVALLALDRKRCPRPYGPGSQGSSDIGDFRSDGSPRPRPPSVPSLIHGPSWVDSGGVAVTVGMKILQGSFSFSSDSFCFRDYGVTDENSWDWPMWLKWVGWKFICQAGLHSPLVSLGQGAWRTLCGSGSSSCPSNLNTWDLAAHYTVSHLLSRISEFICYFSGVKVQWRFSTLGIVKAWMRSHWSDTLQFFTPDSI